MLLFIFHADDWNFQRSKLEELQQRVAARCYGFIDRDNVLCLRSTKQVQLSMYKASLERSEMKHRYTGPKNQGKA